MDREEQTGSGVMLEAAAAELHRRLAGGQESPRPVAPDRAIGRLSRVGAMRAQQAWNARSGFRRVDLTATSSPRSP